LRENYRPEFRKQKNANDGGTRRAAVLSTPLAMSPRFPASNSLPRNRDDACDCSGITDEYLSKIHCPGS
jgi:hypothetical protein